MNHGKDCPHLYHEDGTLRDCQKPCKPEPHPHAKANPGASVFGEVIEGCEDCELSDCRTCGRTIRRCGTVGEDGCELCTPFEDIEPEEIEPSPDYPLGGSVEPHDIEKEKSLTE